MANKVEITGIELKDYLNPNYQLTLDKDTHIVTLYDKKTKRVIGTDTQENAIKISGDYLKEIGKQK
jgi:hypothetical protein